MLILRYQRFEQNRTKILLFILATQKNVKLG